VNARGEGECKPDCEKSVAPLSIELCCELVKAPRSVLSVASVSSGLLSADATGSMYGCGNLGVLVASSLSGILEWRAIDSCAFSCWPCGRDEGR
jgi:hypothetical protein